MGLQQYGLFFAGLLIIALVAAAPVSAASVITIDNTSPNALRDAIGSGSYPIIILNPGIYFEHDITIPIDIVIQANTTYGGSAADTIIDAGNSGRIFDDRWGYALEIDSLTLTRGNAGTDDGGAIYASGGSITLISSVISDCRAYNGGAIHTDTGSSVTITSSTISGCSASWNGGAIYAADGSAITMDGSSTITNCSASHDGGAIYGGVYDTSVGSTVTIDDSSVISGCSAANYGGAIRAAGSGSTIILQRFSSITGCSADQGGAIWASDTVTIVSSSISDCSATYGGAIESGGGAITLTSSSIANSTATDGGGAIDSDADITLESSSSITNCSAGNGGAIYTRGGTLSATSSAFTNCSATSYGGAIYTSGATVIIQCNSTISACSATDGGAIATLNSIVTVGTSTVSGCQASWNGGAIFIDPASTSGSVRITFSALTGCTAGGSGGAIFKGDDDSCSLAISDSGFTGCSAPDGEGGAIFIENSHPDVTITSSSFTGCSAQYGGAIYAMKYYHTFRFLRIVNCGAGAVSDTDARSPATDNWWGTNAGPAGFIQNYETKATPYLMLNATATPASITTAQVSVIEANLTFDSNGADTRASGNLPNTTPVTFGIASGSGTFTPSSGTTMFGRNATTFTPAYAGTTTLSATVDGQTVYITMQVTQGPPAPSGITPGSGINTSAVRITNLAGSSFMKTGTTTVNLTRAGHANITAAGVTVVDNTNITCTLPITGAEAGRRDVVVVNPDGQEGVLADGFTIIAGVPTTVPATSTSPAVLSSSGTSDNDDDYWGTSEFPLMTVTVNIGGDSKAWQAIVTGTKLSDLIVTGTVQPGTGTNQTAPPGIVYQYISLVPARYTGITKAVINFTVPQVWLDENHIAPGSIVLYHQTVNGWEALPTRVLYTIDGAVFFSAESTGFSLFAIAGAPTGTAPVTIATTQGIMNSVVQTPAPAAAGVKAPVTTQTTAPPAPAAKPAAPSPILNIILVIAAIGILTGGGFLVRRWWIRRQNPTLFAEFD